MKFTEQELKKLKEEFNKQVYTLFNYTAKTMPNIELDVVEEDNILEDKAANFKIKKEDLPKDFEDLLLICSKMNATFLSEQVIPFVDKTILKNAPEEVKGLHNVYMSPKYYSDVQDEFDFDTDVMNTIMVPVNRLPENKEYVEIASNYIFNVEVSYKIAQTELNEDFYYFIRVKISKGVIKND